MFLDMKKYFILLAAALLAVACNQEELQDPEGNAVEIPSNGFLAGIETKVSLESDFSLSWEEGDQVAIWNGTELLAPYTAQTAGKTTVLLGEDVNTDLAHCAFYPYDAVVEFEGNTVTAVIPGQQTPKSGTFPFNPSVAYAAAGEQTLQFYNVCGLVGFEITEAEQGVNNVVIFGNNDEDITGTVNVSYDEISAPKATVVKGVKSVTLQATETFAPGTYYVAILPQEYKDGITITMNTPDGKQYKKDSKPFTLRRSHRINAMNINDGEFGAENLISNAAELQAFFNIVNADEEKGAGMVGKIVDDIDLSHIDNFTPAAEFAGTLDGAYTVGEETRNYSISNTTSHLIGTLSATGVVKNINVSGNIEITANDDAAFIALNNAGKISYCKTSGEAKTIKDDLAFTKERAVGAIAARTSGTIEYCTNEAAITLKPKGTAVLNESAAKVGTYNGVQHIGGVVGYATGETAVVDNCTNSAKVEYAADCPVNTITTIGGVLGSTSSETGANVKAGTLSANVTVSNCINNGDVRWSYNAKPNDAYNNLCFGGVAGYIEGSLTKCTNNGFLYAHGWRTEDAGSGYTKYIGFGGVAGVANGNVTDCHNEGNIDVAATLTGGADNAGYVGFSKYSSVGGVVGHSGTNAYTISGCTNKAESMNVDMHMRTGNGSTGAMGGIVAYSEAKLLDCENSAKIDFDNRFKTMYAGGVCGYYAITAVTEGLRNTGDFDFDAGVIPADNAAQSVTLRVGGIIGYLKGNVNNTKSGFKPWINEGDLTITGGNPSTDKYYGGITGYVEATNTTMAVRGEKAKDYWNKGNITVTGSVATTYVGGIHGYMKFTDAKGADAVAMNFSQNDGDITVDVAASAAVAGIVANYNYGCIYGSVNTGKITVNSSKGNLWVGGVAGNAGNGRRMCGMGNEGDIEVTTTSAASEVYLGGVRGFVNGQINLNGKVYNYNNGNISLTTNAKKIQVGGIASGDGATKVYANNSGNVTLTYTGEASTDVTARVSLGVAYRNGSTATVNGTYSGTLTVNNVSGISCDYGLLTGFTKASCVNTLNPVSIKKGTIINGVEVSAVESDPGYFKNQAYLIGAASPSGTLVATNVSLID